MKNFYEIRENLNDIGSKIVILTNRKERLREGFNKDDELLLLSNKYDTLKKELLKEGKDFIKNKYKISEDNVIEYNHLGKLKYGIITDLLPNYNLLKYIKIKNITAVDSKLDILSNEEILSCDCINKIFNNIEEFKKFNNIQPNEISLSNEIEKYINEFEELNNKFQKLSIKINKTSKELLKEKFNLESKNIIEYDDFNGKHHTAIIINVDRMFYRNNTIKVYEANIRRDNIKELSIHFNKLLKLDEIKNIKKLANNFVEFY